MSNKADLSSRADPAETVSTNRAGTAVAMFLSVVAGCESQIESDAMVWRDAACSAIQRCVDQCGPLGPDEDLMNACSWSPDGKAGYLDALNAARDEGLRFDRECFDRHIEDLAERDCDAVEDALAWPWTCPILSGSQQEGEPCVRTLSGSDCARGLACMSVFDDASSVSQCVDVNVPPAAEEPCWYPNDFGRRSHCGPGATCIDGTCVAAHASGSSCACSHESSGAWICEPCEQGYFCMPPSEVGGAEGICAPQLLEGQECSYDTDCEYECAFVDSGARVCEGPRPLICSGLI